MKALLSDESWFSFPFSVHEMTWEQFSDVRACEIAFVKSAQLDDDGEEKEDDWDELSEEFQKGYKEIVLDVENSINHIIELLEFILDGDWEEIPFSVPGDNIKKLFDSKFMFNIKTAFTEEISLMRLYVHTINMIQSYKPEELALDFTTEWKGETYTIDPMEAFNTLNGIDYTAGETLTILEFQKKTYERIEQKGDKDGNMAFNLGSREIAILLRKPGEKLPFKRRERIKFIDERSAIMNDMPLNIVLDIRFFFLNILEKYELTHTTSSFSRGSRTKLQRTKVRRTVRLKLKNGKQHGKLLDGSTSMM